MGDESDASVLLVGPMGSGKSSVGRRLAARLGWGFIDTDSLIESAARMSIPEIFVSEGEAGFRERERAVLKDLPRRQHVVSLGGGALISEGNRALLRERGRLVWLRARAETLVERIRDPASRPLLAGLDREQRLARLRELLAEREAAWATASLGVDTDGCSLSQICGVIVRELGLEEQP